MTDKLNPIERALVAAAGMGPPDARSVLMLICQAGSKSAASDWKLLDAVEQPTPGQIHFAKREKIIKRTKSECDRVIDYAKHETLRKVEKHFRDTGMASAEGDEPKTLAEQLAFKKQRFSEEMAAVLREEATVALATAGQQLFDEVGSENVWKTPAADALKYLDARENLFANASDEIHGEVMQQLQDGLEHGETKKELMARIGATFDGIKQTRADTIANTETAAAFNFARDKAMREAGVTHKKWLHSQRPEQEPRPTHVENDGQTVPIDDPFDIGGVKFMYPSDDSLGAGPEDIINCNCLAIPVEAPPKGKTLIEVFANEIRSGDVPGHEFHGNQYVDLPGHVEFGDKKNAKWRLEHEQKMIAINENMLSSGKSRNPAKLQANIEESKRVIERAKAFIADPVAKETKRVFVKAFVPKWSKDSDVAKFLHEDVEKEVQKQIPHLDPASVKNLVSQHLESVVESHRADNEGERMGGEFWEDAVDMLAMEVSDQHKP